MSKPSSPQTPDYVGAANATAASQRVNYMTPWGSINWFAPGQQPSSQYRGGLYSPSVEQGAQPGMQVPGTPGRMHALDTGSPGPSGPGDPGGAASDGNMTAGGPTPIYGTNENGNSMYTPPPANNPYPGLNSGGQQYNMDPWTQVVSLSPDQQRLYDQQMQTSLGLAGLQNQGLEGVRGVFADMPSQADLPPRVLNPGQTGQDAIMSRTQPLLNRQQDRMNNQLANQGIQVGSEAYSNAQNDFGRQANDAYNQAVLRGIDLTNQQRQQAMGEQGFYSQLPINLLNALRSGSQVQLPTGPTTGPGANYMGAAQAQGQAALGQYGADTSAYNSQMGAGASVLAALLASYSDRRLKSNIVRIGTHPLGIGRYEYDIFDRREQGVMADEVEAVMPDAVVTGADGYKRVYYHMIGGR